MSLIEKARTRLQGIAAGDAALATRWLSPDRFVEHDPHVGDGVEGLGRYVDEVAAADLRLDMVRAFADRDHVVTQADGNVRGDGSFFDVFRFEDGLVVEHWGFSMPAAPPNRSGHTQVDGPTEPQDRARTEQNKAFMRDYYETVHVNGRHEAIPRYFAGNACARHEPGVADGVDEFRRDLARLTQNRTIDGIELLVGEGDFVFIAARGTHEGEPCVYVDLFRVAGDAIVEHWGFPEMVPPPAERKNANGML